MKRIFENGTGLKRVSSSWALIARPRRRHRQTYAAPRRPQRRRTRIRCPPQPVPNDDHVECLAYHPFLAHTSLDSTSIRKRVCPADPVMRTRRSNSCRTSTGARESWLMRWLEGAEGPMTTGRGRTLRQGQCKSDRVRSGGPRRQYARKAYQTARRDLDISKAQCISCASRRPERLAKAITRDVYAAREGVGAALDAGGGICCVAGATALNRW